MLKAEKIKFLNILILIDNNIIEKRSIWKNENNILFFEDYITGIQYIVKKSYSKKYNFKVIDKIVPNYYN